MNMIFVCLNVCFYLKKIFCISVFCLLPDCRVCFTGKRLQRRCEVKRRNHGGKEGETIPDGQSGAHDEDGASQAAEGRRLVTKPAEKRQWRGNDQ